MTPEQITKIQAGYSAWRKALKSDDTDEWHFTATALAERIPELLAEVERLTAGLADPRRDLMYHDRYFAVQHVLNEALGPNEEDGAGEGIAADVALLAQQRNELEADRDRLSEALAEADREIERKTKALQQIEKRANRMRNSHSVFAEILSIAQHAAEPTPQAVTRG